jgi:hypothetical protein
MGILGPNFKELGEFFDKMQKDVETNAEKYGFLGASSWIGNGERATGNDLLTVMYFKTAEGVHAFAHDPCHRDGWLWWNKIVATSPYISIWHELYVAPKGHYESIYVNTEPILFGATVSPVGTKEGKKWISSVVDASRGVLKSSRSRMTLTDGENIEHADWYGTYPST